MLITEPLLVLETPCSEQQMVETLGAENTAEQQKDFGESPFPIQITERQLAHLVQSSEGRRALRHLRQLRHRDPLPLLDLVRVRRLALRRRGPRFRTLL